MAKFEHRPACEFWLGRAGSGKTHGCLAAIAGLLQESPRGEPLILLAPEQATAQLERRLACWPGLAGGFTRARVLSFHHLAHEAFMRAGGMPRRTPDEMARLMLIRRAMRELGGEMKVFRGAGPGLAESLAAMLLEMERYGWKAADIAEWRASLSEGERKTDLLARKLGDLELLWEKYRELLDDGGWDDPATRTEAAAAAIENWDGVAGARVWIDGFASFTAQETKLLESLLKRTRSAVIALCADPAIATGAQGLERIGPERLFENVEQTYQLLSGRFRDLVWTVTTRTLPADANLTRFASSPALAHLEREVLDRLEPRPYSESNVAPAPSPAIQNSYAHQPIELIEAADRRGEIEAVARRLARLCRNHPDEPMPAMTWRDTAVLARDLKPYENLVREIFQRWRIPFFLDRPRTIFGHPLARLILTTIELVRSGWRGEAFLQFVKCGLSPLGDLDALSRLENLVLATDTEGRAWRQRLDKDDDAAIWKRAVAPAIEFERRIADEPPARALWALLDSVHAAESIEGWIVSARAAGDEEDAMLHEQAWEQTVAWLETMDALDAKDRAFFKPPESREEMREMLDELSALAQTALSSTQARLTPPTLNQVTVGSVDRSRTPEVKALFVLGLNEREFPKLWTPDPVLGDEERGRLSIIRRLGPDSRKKTLHEQFLVYVAMTRSSGAITLSRPLRDEDGKPADPSPCFRRARQAFANAPLLSIGRAGEGDHEWLPARPEEWTLRLAGAVDALGAPEQAARLAGLMLAGDPLDSPETDNAERGALVRARAMLAGASPAALDPESAKRFWAQRGSISVTGLEEFSACPYGFFAMRMLGIEEREQWRLGAMDLGTMRHSLLEAIYEECKEANGRLDWGKLDTARADRAIEKRLKEIAEDPERRDLFGASALTRMQLDRLGADIRLFVEALRAAGALCRFVQIDAEKKLDRPDPWTIEAGGVQLKLNGTIDRIDAAEGSPKRPCVLIDYKSGSRKIDLGRMIEGRDLQLLAYGIAWRRMNSRDWIAGLFYWPLYAPTREAMRGDSNARLIDADWFGKCGPAGLFDERIAQMLDCSVQPGGKALAFGFSLTKSGQLNKSNRAHWPAGALDKLLNHAERNLEEQMRRIVGGEIALGPCRSGSDEACAKCACGPICRVLEIERVPWRWIGKYTREQAIELLEAGQ